MLQRGEEGVGDGHLDPAGPASIAISARFAGSNGKDAGVEGDGDVDHNGGGGRLTSNKRQRQTSRQRKRTYDATKKSAEKVVILEKTVEDLLQRVDVSRNLVDANHKLGCELDLAATNIASFIHNKKVLVKKSSAVRTKIYRKSKRPLVAETFGDVGSSKDEKETFIRKGVKWVINKAYPWTKDWKNTSYIQI